MQQVRQGWERLRPSRLDPVLDTAHAASKQVGDAVRRSKFEPASDVRTPRWASAQAGRAEHRGRAAAREAVHIALSPTSRLR